MNKAKGDVFMDNLSICISRKNLFLNTYFVVKVL